MVCDARANADTVLKSYEYQYSLTRAFVVFEIFAFVWDCVGLISLLWTLVSTYALKIMV